MVNDFYKEVVKLKDENRQLREDCEAIRKHFKKDNSALKKALSDNFKRIEGRDTKIIKLLEQIKTIEQRWGKLTLKLVKETSAVYIEPTVRPYDRGYDDGILLALKYIKELEEQQ